ncbi:MAG: type III-A CRISPR-associated protein Cas10/Csm1 [Pseudomonadota bacterium]|nr:type III-A CRISPR-associated protein Cas10/Csm1 [Pseudomonadota bacterium]
MFNQGDDVWLSHAPLVPEYAELANGFLHGIEDLPQPARAGDEAYRAVFQSLLSLMERFMTQVPAATNIQRPDISLYDHLRVTAAIAEGLYHHHAARGTLDEPRGFHDRESSKWRLICGDFFGIQSFIYRITSKGAAKALRGRSLYIQLLCDAVSERLLRRLDLYPTARIYSSGGKFYLLIADCLEGRLRDLVDDVNAWLLDELGGDVFLGIGVAEVRGSDFREGAMGPRWKAANEDLMRNRERRFHGLLRGRGDFFEPQPLHPQGSCQVCGRDDEKAELRTDDSGSQSRKICSQCDRLERLGGRLGKSKAFFWAWDDDRRYSRDQWPAAWKLSLDEIGCDLYLLGDSKAAPPSSASLTLCHKEALNDPDCLDGNPYGYSCGFRFLGVWNRDKESGEWDFEGFAEKARGIQRMGVLRMDVDNLGKILVNGLRFTGASGTKEMGSLSRVATLSRQLHLFFAGYLNTLVARFPRTRIIYAGGDDLFLVGSWDELPAVASSIRKQFSAYACYNSAFTVSGGLGLVPGKYPISRSAELAGAEEGRAKLLQRADGRTKNAFPLL